MVNLKILQPAGCSFHCIPNPVSLVFSALMTVKKSSETKMLNSLLLVFTLKGPSVSRDAME